MERRTKETAIKMLLNLSGKGKHNIKTSIAFMDHMLTLFTHHGNFDLTVSAKGDTEIDDHHLVEDIGIVLGQAVKKTLGDKKGIQRYGNFLMPMDEALSYIAIDISARPCLVYKVKFAKSFAEKFNYSLLEEFFQAFANNAGVTLHISMKHGRNNHHIAESIFKGFGRALAQAVKKDAKIKRVPSTKGKL
ncbi:MAG: imidazoleglycerol-phosphate dehydratase HisB [Elusimicrobia bacterium]|nr:imidazoleglycerol-phosphate dehydratase HisB [Elusimicrobiota bacterium]